MAAPQSASIPLPTGTLAPPLVSDGLADPVALPPSFLSEGKAGAVCGGDRLPWVDANGVDNFMTLTKLDWQIHVYGEVDVAFRAEAQALNLLVISHEWSHQADKVGLHRNAFYLVRPDDYVALAHPVQNAATLRSFCDTRELSFRSAHS